jgi:HSP20 family protein
MVGIRKRKDFFEDFGSELFDNLEEIIEALLEEMGESGPSFTDFSIIHRPGRARTREFGNVPEHSQKEENFFPSETKEPLLMYLKMRIRCMYLQSSRRLKRKISFCMPPLSTLKLKSSDFPDTSEDVDLPVPVDPKSAKASYKNGVLEVTFKRSDEDKPVENKVN